MVHYSFDIFLFFSHLCYENATQFECDMLNNLRNATTGEITLKKKDTASDDNDKKQHERLHSICRIDVHQCDWFHCNSLIQPRNVYSNLSLSIYIYICLCMVKIVSACRLRVLVVSFKFASITNRFASYKT